MTLSEYDLGRKAWEILCAIFGRIEHVSEAGTERETLARYLADEMVFLDYARENELPVATLAALAKEIAGLHARIVQALRDREEELTPGR